MRTQDEGACNLGPSALEQLSDCCCIDYMVNIYRGLVLAGNPCLLELNPVVGEKRERIARSCNLPEPCSHLYLLHRAVRSGHELCLGASWSHPRELTVIML